MLRRSLGPVVAVLVLGSLSGAPSAGAARSPAHPVVAAAVQPAVRGAGPGRHKIGFSSPFIVDTVHTYGEPSIMAGTHHTVYDSGPWGTGTQRSIWTQSTDGGKTFHPLHTPPITSPAQSDTQIPGPGGGDTELAIDRTGKVYYSDLAALVTLKTATWTRKTRTLHFGAIHSGKAAINGYDRQWQNVWDPKDRAGVRKRTGYTGSFPISYILYTELSGVGCSSLSGTCHDARWSKNGVNYSDATVQSLDQNDGSTVIDQATGTVFMATSLKSPGDVGVDIFTRNPAAHKSPALRKVKGVEVAALPKGSSTGNAVPFPTVSLDHARNLYLVWTTVNTKKTAAQDPRAWQVYYSYSRANSGWTQWSKPRKISHAPARTNLFVWSQGGAKGRLAVAWYGTPDAKHNPSSEDRHQPWDVYLNMITHAASSRPVQLQQKVTPHPMHYGTICLEGLGCAAENPPGNRNLADFFELAQVSRTGAVIITYDDTSNELKQHPAPGSPVVPEQADHRGAPLVVMLRQNSGIGLLGTRVHGLRKFGKGVRDGKSDARFDPVYTSKNIPQLDIRGSTVRGSGKFLFIKIRVTSLDDVNQAFSATNAGAIDYLARWNGRKKPAPTGVRNPLWFAAVEVLPGGNARFFAGESQSIELCSVSGCFPHILEYPEPPQGNASSFVTGRLVRTRNKKPDYWLIKVPRNLVGSPRNGSRLQSYSAYDFARNKSASVPITNSEGESGITPVMVDGACCVDAKVLGRT